jgi:V8-like Glu-specific endopeptidase
MRPRHAIAPHRATPCLLVGLTVVVSLVAGGSIAITEVALAKDQVAASHAADGRARPVTEVVPTIGVVHTIGTGAQAAARSYWTSARMSAATGAGENVSPAGVAPAGVGAAGRDATGARAVQRQAAVMGSSSPASGPPHGTPSPQSFSGVPTVGALFYTKGNSNHFCTASVVHSSVGSLVMTAAHCVYSSSGYSQNLEFIPGYDGGPVSYGIWPVTQITVAKGWRQGANPNLDVAFLNVEPPPNSVGPIEQVTGALQIAFALPDAQHITVIGYNNTDQKPIMCTTTSFKFRPDQMEFYCRGFWFGTSGGPWILKYNSNTGTGTVYGVIGGYEAGGYVAWASYAAALEQPAEALLTQAEASAASASSSAAKASTAKAGAGKSAQTQVKASVS